MVHVDEAGTVYLNAATVPRVRKPVPPSPVAVNGRRQKVTKAKRTQASQQGKAAAVAAALQGQAPTQHHFLVVEMAEGVVCRAADVWVEAQPSAVVLAAPGEDLDPAGPQIDAQESATDGSSSGSSSNSGDCGGASTSGGEDVVQKHPGVGQQYSVKVAQEIEVYRRQTGVEMSEHRYFDAYTGRHVTAHTMNCSTPHAVPVG